MNFAGKYSYHVSLEGRESKMVLALRETDRGYEGEIISSRGADILGNIVAREKEITVEAGLGDRLHQISLFFDEEGKVSGKGCILEEGEKKEAYELRELSFSPKKLRALILYATMTKNTEKIARAMEESFLHYKWEVTFFRMTMKAADWEGMQEKLYFDDYDVIALGSPIVAGYPLTVVNKVFSLGAGGELEAKVQEQVDAGDGFQANSDTIKPPPGEVGGPGGPDAEPPKKRIGAMWRRRSCPFPGGPSADNYRPVGIVFTTYGGGFFGSNEALATLAALKLFLELANVDVIGQFACVGKEFGPAGLKEGEKPMLIRPGQMPDPNIYETAEGEKITASYFFHGQPWNHPNDKDVIKAKILVSDLVEDMFMTYNGKRAQVKSEYISIS
jgi:flavodoxin